MARVRVIFFDAVGTLFGVRGSVGHFYSQVAQCHGVKVDPQALDRAFSQVFKSTPPALFPPDELDTLQPREREWWRQVVIQTFQVASKPETVYFSDFDSFFTEVFDLFATECPWQIYKDTLGTLETLHTQGYRLGIISNFDSRLVTVLESLKLAPFFSSVTISTQTGSAKPQEHVFQTALAQAQISAAEALHVGDSFSMDYLGAKQAGLHALWLDREQEQVHSPRSIDAQERISDLEGILTWLVTSI